MAGYVVFNPKRRQYYAGYSLVDGAARPRWSDDRQAALRNAGNKAACAEAIMLLERVVNLREPLEVVYVNVCTDWSER